MDRSSALSFAISIFSRCERERGREREDVGDLEHGVEGNGGGAVARFRRGGVGAVHIR